MSQNVLKFESSQKTIVIFLGAIIVGGISFRLFFSHFELPLNSDNIQYFWYAIDHSLGETNSIQVHNTGWPLFLSFFFSNFSSGNYMDFMALQKIISIVISSLTAIPIYFLGKKFFSKELALLGSFLFVFEPRIVQNSTFGISDPLYIIGLTTAIGFLIYSRKNFEFLSFAILGFSIGVRSEGLFLIPAFVIVYLWQKKISKQTIFKILISLLIISLILTVITIHRNAENESLVSRIDIGITEVYSSPETTLAGGPVNLMIEGVINFVKFLGWSQFPIWMFFVPAGFIILLISKNQKTGIIFSLLFFISLPTLYAFSFANDTRYLFPLYPIFSIMSLFLLDKINQKSRKFSYLQVAIVIGLISTSSLFLIWKDIDAEKEVALFDLVKNISDKQKVVNHFGYETSYVIPAGLEKIENFPVTSDEIGRQSMTVVNIPRLSTIEGFIQFSSDNNLTHWIIKDQNSYKFLDEIFQNEDRYPYLIKEFDSTDDEFQNNLKIFRVDYDKIQ